MPDTARPRRYAKPVAIADDLALLRGPITGLVTLPPRLDRSGSPSYGLDGPGRLVDPAWADLCRDVGVRLAWPGAFDRI